MGLTCSLLGHAFEEADVERERSAEGDEVVTVVREVERCARCGDVRVVSENTEVTAVVDADDLDDDASAAGEAMANVVERAGAADVDENRESDPPTSDARPDAEPTANAAESDESAATGPNSGGTAEEKFEPPDDPSEEDAEILENESPSERQPGQWPDDDEPFDPDGLSGEAADQVSTPAETDDEGANAADVDAAGNADSGGRDRSADEPPEPAAGPTLGGVDAAEASYVCPSCGFEAPAASSSLREGDACPDCTAGWLRVERNR